MPLPGNEIHVMGSNQSPLASIWHGDRLSKNYNRFDWLDSHVWMGKAFEQAPLFGFFFETNCIIS